MARMDENHEAATAMAADPTTTAQDISYFVYAAAPRLPQNPFAAGTWQHAAYREAVAAEAVAEYRQGAYESHMERSGPTADDYPA